MNKFAYDLPKDLYKGMRVRPSMDMIVNYIEKDPYNIKYPNRDATFYLNSPQFLNILSESGLGMSEQSKNLAERQLKEAQARAEGRGGAADMAVDEDAVSTTGDAENTDRLAVAEQTRRRQEAEENFRRQREAELQALRDRRVVAQQLAARTAEATTTHPVAAAAAASVPLLTGTRDPVYTPTPGAPFATVAASASAALAPFMSQLYSSFPRPPTVLNVPRPAEEQGMSSGVQQKRAVEGEGDGESPKAKAKPSGATGKAPPPPKAAASAEASSTSSRVRATSKTPLKGEESIKRATRIREDISIRSNKSELEKFQVPELRALLELENIKTFTNEKGVKVNTSNATKPDIVNELVRHFELIDRAGASSSASVRTPSVSAGKKKKEKKDEEGGGGTTGASSSKKKK